MISHPLSTARRSTGRLVRKGFTLIEVLLVLAILGVIAAMVVPQLLGRQKEAMVKATKASIKGLEDALQQYALSHDGEYPQGSRDEAFSLLIKPGNDADGRPIAPYLDKVPLDAWGQGFYYENPNSKVPNATKPAIWSSGANKQNEDGSGDDINNWANLAL
ncbi:type II secretion system major pseudopilin GspG [Planctopirus hydrillae]|uniref:Type II secretion system core protein G n=1 Tax=Planctopirus hydrillae TaxID=1841610 RepID=A0A1C3ECM7_9PLAN|nr:type II secretion system major pseudopilin GspG [Planctopirus hydrillae]ODA30975.1 type II secretion system protein GspG [Planctopirus hydrillae]